MLTGRITGIRARVQWVKRQEPIGQGLRIKKGLCRSGIKSLRVRISLCSWLLVLSSWNLIQAQDCNRCHADQSVLPLLKSMGTSEKAVGVMDKGQLQNNTSNVGDLANFHLWFTNAGHWPRSADYDRQYLFGMGLVVAVDEHNVVETVSQAMTKITDWLPPDDAAGRHYSGDIRAESDQTPFQASSDFLETWPYGYYDENGVWTSSEDRMWPGYFRVDVNNTDPDTLEMHPPAVTLRDRVNEFTSDRDIFCIYNDDGNPQGVVGLEVEQTAYSYGRPYAEDFVFWDLKIYNDSGHDLEDIFVGFYAKFRPDYDMHDYINFVDSDNDGQRDFIYVYDLNNVLNKTWANYDDPLGIVGLRVYDTPGQLGITNFHHFARGVSPDTDEKMWALMTSLKEDSILGTSSWYFHGEDERIDYTGEDSLAVFYPQWYDEESGVDLEGDGINFILSSGPFTLQADSMVTLSLGLVMGDAGELPNEPDTTDLMTNVRMANDMYRLYFQGSGPPDPPVVEAVAGDERVTLYWTSEPSESATDVLTGEMDFEGYKVFRSTDQGVTWGDVVTNAHGIPVGWEPIATFDYSLSEDLLRYGVDVSGLDPAFPQFLGTNSGLAHTFVDSNLINGLEYWYCVSAYDRGNQDTDSLEQSYLYPLGSSDLEPHTVSVVPGVPPTNFTRPAVPEDQLEPIGGLSGGIVKVELVDPAAITGHGYKVTFGDSIEYVTESGETILDISFTLVDTTENDTLFHNHQLSDDSGDNLPVVDGFRLTVQNTPTGVEFIGWTKVSGDTSTFDWRTESKRPDLVPSGQAYGDLIESIDDFRITIDTTVSGGLEAGWYDLYQGVWANELDVGLDSTIHLPLKVEIVTDTLNPVDISDHTILGEFYLNAPWEDYRRDYYSPIGWDLIPGGAGFTPASPGWYELHVDVLIFSDEDSSNNYLYLLTNNAPDTFINANNDSVFQEARPPSHGDQFTIRTYKPFRQEISYTFGTTAIEKVAGVGSPFDSLKVVPDPYVVTNLWETGEFGKKLKFNNLPDLCTIRIYTLVGEHIATIKHDSDVGYEFWDMRTRNDQFIAPGVYLFHAETPAGEEKLGRFLVIK